MINWRKVQLVDIDSQIATKDKNTFSTTRYPTLMGVEDDKKRINIKADGKPVLSYNHAIVKAPNRDESYYDKSGHIHPLYTPSGKSDN